MKDCKMKDGCGTTSPTLIAYMYAALKKVEVSIFTIERTLSPR
jgi:hypothetical protein